MFASPFTVVATNADVVVAIETFQQVLKLTVKHFLSAENQWIHEVNLVAYHLTALGPDVAVKTVVAVFIPDIIRADEHLLRHGSKRQNAEKSNKKKLFHFTIFVLCGF